MAGEMAGVRWRPIVGGRYCGLEGAIVDGVLWIRRCPHLVCRVAEPHGYVEREWMTRLVLCWQSTPALRQ